MGRSVDNDEIWASAVEYPEGAEVNCAVLAPRTSSSCIAARRITDNGAFTTERCRMHESSKVPVPVNRSNPRSIECVEVDERQTNSSFYRSSTLVVVAVTPVPSSAVKLSSRGWYRNRLRILTVVFCFLFHLNFSDVHWMCDRPLPATGGVTTPQQRRRLGLIPRFARFQDRARNEFVGVDDRQHIIFLFPESICTPLRTVTWK